MKSYNELIEKNYFIFFIIIISSIASYFSFGVSTSSMRIYIHGPLSLIENGIEANFFNTFFTSKLSLQYYLLTLLKPIFENKIYYSILTVLYKSCCIFLLNEILKKFFKKKLSILFSILFFLAPTYYSHGMIVNGAWSAHMFINASASFLFSLLALLLLLKKNYLISIIFCSISLNFHPLYGINFTIYFLFFYLISENKNIFSYLYLSLIIFSIFIISNISSIEAIPSDSELSVKQWMQNTFYFNTNDFSYLNNLIDFNFNLIFLSAYFFYNFFKIKRFEELDKFIFISILFNFLIILIELFHSLDFNFGVLSEYFIQLQLRRGVWILHLFLLIYFFKEIFLVNNNKNKFHNIAIVTITGSLIVYPSFLLLFFINLYLFKNKKIEAHFFFITNFILFFFLLIFRDIHFQNLFWYYLLSIFVFVSILYFLMKKLDKHYDVYLMLSLLTIFIIVLFICFGLINKKNEKFIYLGVNLNNSSGINLKDSKISIDDFYPQMRSSRDCIYNHFYQSDKSKIKLKPSLINIFSNLNYTDSAFYKTNLYLDKSDIFRGATSRSLYLNLASKLDSLFYEEGFTNNFFKYTQNKRTAVIQYHRIFYYNLKKDIMNEKLLLLDKILIDKIEKEKNFFHSLKNKADYIILNKLLSEKFSESLICENEKLFIYSLDSI